MPASWASCDPGVGVELHGVELRGELARTRATGICARFMIHSPIPGIRAPLPFARGNGVQPPVNEQPVLRLAEPLEARLLLRVRRRRGLLCVGGIPGGHQPAACQECERVDAKSPDGAAHRGPLPARRFSANFPLAILCSTQYSMQHGNRRDTVNTARQPVPRAAPGRPGAGRARRVASRGVPATPSRSCSRTRASRSTKARCIPCSAASNRRGCSRAPGGSRTAARGATTR